MVDFEWLWHAFIARWLWWVLGLAGAGVLGYLKKKHPTWTGPALYGLGGFVLIVAILFIFEARTYLPQREITPDNIESKIRVWLTSFGYGYISRQDPQFYFAIQVNLPTNRPVLITRPKNTARYITVSGTVTVTEPHVSLLAK